MKVGCFEDRFHSRALPELIANYRGSDQFDWFNLDKHVKKCAEEAKKRNYMFFGYVYIKSRYITNNNKLSNNDKLVTEFFCNTNKEGQLRYRK